jgi:hypothetical protein
VLASIRHDGNGPKVELTVSVPRMNGVVQPVYLQLFTDTSVQVAE